MSLRFWGRRVCQSAQSLHPLLLSGWSADREWASGLGKWQVLLGAGNSCGRKWGGQGWAGPTLMVPSGGYRWARVGVRPVQELPNCPGRGSREGVALRVQPGHMGP